MGYSRAVRSYGQYCSVAKALDIIGDRWTLLIVRELLVQGPCRYTDLRNGLPGVASNLLSSRLKEMEASGLVVKQNAPAPVATTLFSLSERGRDLEPVLTAIGTWGLPMMTSPKSDDVFRSQWFTFVVTNYLHDRLEHEPALDIELRATSDAVHIHVEHGSVVLCRGSAEDPTLTLSGEPSLMMGLLTNQLSLDDARALGLDISGDTNALKRITAGDDEAD